MSEEQLREIWRRAINSDGGWTGTHNVPFLRGARADVLALLEEVKRLKNGKA